MKLTKSNFNDFYKNQIVEAELKNIIGGHIPPPGDPGDVSDDPIPPVIPPVIPPLNPDLNP